jgi:hypothetical protein
MHLAENRRTVPRLLRIVGHALWIPFQGATFVTLFSTLAFAVCHAVYSLPSCFTSSVPHECHPLGVVVLAIGYSPDILGWRAALVGAVLISALTLRDWWRGQRARWRTAIAAGVGLATGVVFSYWVTEGLAAWQMVVLTVVPLIIGCVVTARMPKPTALDLVVAAVCAIGLSISLFVLWMITHMQAS